MAFLNRMLWAATAVFMGHPHLAVSQISECADIEGASFLQAHATQSKGNSTRPDLRKLLDVFFTKKLDMVVIGLENSGKTTLLEALAEGHPIEIVENVKVLQKGRVRIQSWDVGGQAQPEWSRHGKGSDVVLFVADAAAPQKLPKARRSLHKLLDDGSIGSRPLLVLGNKIDITPHVGKDELIEQLQLNYVMETPWTLFLISALHLTNMDQAVEWLIEQARP